jgi:hypothetical protein
MSSIAFGSPKSQLITDFSHQMLKVDQNLKIHENLKISPVFPNYPIFFKFCKPILSSTSIPFLEKKFKISKFWGPKWRGEGAIFKIFKILFNCGHLLDKQNLYPKFHRNLLDGFVISCVEIKKSQN